MYEQFTLILDNVSQRMGELPAQVTLQEVDGNCKEARETEFGDYNGNFACGICSWYTSHIVHYNWT